MASSKVSYGFDLGCSTCCTAFVDENNIPKVVDLHCAYSSNTAPSYVCYDNTSEKIMVGGAALNKLSNPKYNVVYNSKQFIGKKWRDLNKEKINAYSFELVEKGEKPYYKVLYNNRETYLSAVDVTSEIIKEINQITLKRVAGEMISPDKVTIVIGIPSAFLENEKNEIISSAAKAGLKNVDTICEQEAVALAYITAKKEEIEKKRDCKFLICDFGGNCFNASIVEYKNNEIQIIGRYGEDNIGGEEITKILEEKIKKEILKETGIDVNKNKKQKVRVYQACEEAKKYLSSTNEYEMSVNLDKDTEFTKKVTRSRMKYRYLKLLKRTINIINILLMRRNITIKDINYVICVGGSSRIPAFEEMLKKRIGDIPLLKNISPDEAVAIGCSIHANNKIKGTENIKIKDYIPPNHFAFCISVENSNTAAALCRYDKIECITYNDCKTYRKTVVVFSSDEDYIMCGMDPLRNESFAAEPMKYIGKKYKDFNENELKNKPYKLIEGEDGCCLYEVKYNKQTVKYSPTELLSMILKHVKNQSIPFISCNNDYDVNNYPVIMTIPVSFRYNQIVEYKKAAQKAGLKTERFIKEPIAAAFAYINHGSINKSNCNILIADFGESSFKSSIFNLDGNDMTLISYSENDKISGNEIKRIFENYIFEDIKKETGIDMNNNPKMKKRIRRECEDAIIMLSSSQSYYLDLEFEDGDCSKEISRDEFNKMFSFIINGTVDVIHKSEDYGKVKNIDYIILIGGSSKIPYFREIILRNFNHIPILCDINSEEAFSQGAALYSHSYHDENSFYYRINEVLLRSISIGVKESKKPDISYGIDLGTTYSSSAFVGIDSNIHVINPNDGSKNSIPSCICYEKENEKKTFGLSAQTNPKLLKGEATLLYDSKRFIGKEIYDINEDEIFFYPFEIVEKDDNPYYRIKYDKKEIKISPEEVSSELIKHIHSYSIHQMTSKQVDPSDVQVIIGVPAAFALDQREATIKAAERNGLYNIDLLSEPTAAALSYIYSNKIEM